MADVLDGIKDFFFGKPKRSAANDGYDDYEDFEDEYSDDAYFSGDDLYDEEESAPAESSGGGFFKSFRASREDRGSRRSYAREEESDGYSYEESRGHHSAQNSAHIVLVKARHFSEAKRIAENLKQNRSVLINFEDMERGEAQRTIDFLSGAAYANDGQIQKISGSSIIFAVGQVDLVGRIEEMKDADSYFTF